MNSGTERYRISESVETIGLKDLAAELAALDNYRRVGYLRVLSDYAMDAGLLILFLFLCDTRHER